MMKKKQVTISNVQDHHTLGEYQRYFSHLLKKGKLKKISLKEKNKLDPKRQYWKIKDELGKTYYYEVPRYIKPSSTKSAYSMNRVMHRRPARAVLAIFAGTAIISFTSAVVAKRIFTTSYPEIQPTDLSELQEKLYNYQKWAKDHPGEDVTKSGEFTINDLANTAVATALYDPDSYQQEGDVGHYDRRPLLTVGFGHTITKPLGLLDVYVNVTNSFTYDEGDALEESISFSSDGMAPEVAKRDFYYKDEEMVMSHEGTAKTKIDATWKEEVKEGDKFSRDDYIKGVGKIPDSPFLYIISEETLLSGSNATKINNGYKITMKLDTSKSVAGYARRIAYLSKRRVDRFNKVNLTFVTDNNLQLLTSEVNESYDVHHDILGPLPTTGELKTTFYYEDVPNIPKDVTTPFDYRPYQAK